MGTKAVLGMATAPLTAAMGTAAVGMATSSAGMATAPPTVAGMGAPMVVAMEVQMAMVVTRMRILEHPRRSPRRE